MSDRPVTLGAAYRFFAPLILMTELNAISKSVIHAFLARSVAPSTTLAAFNIAFTFYYSLTSTTEVSVLLTLSYLKHRRGLWHLLTFFVLLASLPLTLALLVAFTPLGDWVYGTLFGASQQAVAQAKWATFILTLSAPVLLARALAFGILMLHKRTIFITIATAVRLLSLAVSLLVLPHFLSGAAVGAGALASCMLAETLVAWSFALGSFRRMPRSGELPPFTELWRFAWPLILNQSSELGVAFVINVFLGRLANPDLALAAFGVVHALVSLLFSPVRNLVATVQTLVRTIADTRVMNVFCLQLAAIFASAAIVLFNTPLDHWVLRTVMGLSAELEATAAPAMRFAFVMAVFWSYSALFRGLLAGARSTKALAATGAARLACATLVSGAAALSQGLNGALLGLAAWIVAYASEVLMLWLWLRRPSLHGDSDERLQSEDDRE